MAILSSAGIIAGSLVGGVGWNVIYRKRHKMDLVMQELFESCGMIRKVGHKVLRPQFKKKKRIKNGWQLYYELPLGLNISGALAHMDEWEEQLRADVQLELSGREFKIEVVHGHLRDLILWKPSFVEEIEKRELSVPIGITRSKTLFYDFEHDEPHMLVGGLTKSGKSSFLASVILTLSLAKSPEQVQFYLIDGKWAVEFGAFEELPHVKRVGENIQQAKQILRIVEREVAERAKEFRRHGVRKLSTYMKKTKKKMPYIIVIVDELAQFKAKGAPTSERKERQQLQMRFANLAQTGRFAGVHLVVATQMPYSDNIGSELKQQCGATLAYRTRNKTGSQVLIEKDDAAELPLTPGRAIFQMRTEMTVQTFLLREETQEKLIKQVQEKWKDYISDSPNEQVYDPANFDDTTEGIEDEELYVGEEEQTEQTNDSPNIERLSLLPEDSEPESGAKTKQRMEG